MLNGDLLKTEFVGGTAEVAGWGVTDPGKLITKKIIKVRDD